ncbi:MAG: AAA family ATPase [Gammaproteobacteria bacterium]|nr:AAA family ATPase [Gammaproteobacteria bacterium]MCP4090125.1 AAA family ATPase [Gammaproteobacteria bacterium]MCP4276985.1 AAA family ATPase [Gammaproteobacteria bacterium]MCP4831757.1 AAA family ATPase [Gammaproteobacteria bacterium]MCP4929488.1 AAA family ATPase [Gammaproteobacteria bacterium]
MYEHHFGLSEAPFALLPDPSFLYMSKDHSMALTFLRYSILNKQGFTVISGEVGSGKTTLINRTLDELESDITVGLINFTHNAFGELSEWVLMAFGLEYREKSKVEIYDDFVKFLIEEYRKGQRVVLIIDEAQNMDAHTLEELRMLSNVNAQKDYLLHLIIVGQPELRITLQKPELRQLAQRVSVFYHLGELSLIETQGYIAHRLEVSGGNPELFSSEAIRHIWTAAKGVPRIINTLCDLSLVYGFSASQDNIDAAIVTEVLNDRQKMGLQLVPEINHVESGLGVVK